MYLGKCSMASSNSMSCSSCSASLVDYEHKSNKQISAYCNMMIAVSLIHLALLTSFGALPFTI